MNLNQRIAALLPLVVGCGLLAGLQTGCRTAYYATYEKFGVYKRDLLKTRVMAARDGQKEAGEQFKDALTRLKELYAFEGGDLEKNYRSIQADYDDSVAQADVVRKRIRAMEQVANDLFKEWENEIAEISSPALQTSSRQKLSDTRARYEIMHKALLQAEQSMEPVLRQFHDQVLYLKHNLNAAAIASLKGESLTIQNDITRLITQMNASITKADEFVKTLE